MTEVSTLLPNYDDLPLGSLRHRIRALDEAQLRTVLDYERDHANRTPVLEVLAARLAELDRGAEPSEGNQENTPETTSARGGSPVGRSTAAEPHTPLRHGQSGQTPNRG